MHYKNWLLAVLFVAYVFSGIDGMALGLVQQDVKRDLSLTDTQLGALTGIAFALMYSTVGVAIARWADRGNRVAIISLAAAVWSGLVVACGTATNFVQLFLLRAGVGIGEAGCVPASQSLIADYFDRTERPRANAIYFLGSGVIFLVGYGVAGWLNQLYGWRTMFMTLGLPGLAVAALVQLTLREPRFESSRGGELAGRGTRSPLTTTSVEPAPPRLKETAMTLWRVRTLRHVLLFWAVCAFFNSALTYWQSVFFVRSHGLTTGELGTCFAVVYGVGAMSGTFLGGVWASRYAANNERLQLRVGSLGCCGLVLVAACTYLVPNAYLALGFLGLLVMVVSAFTAPSRALMQTLVPESMRATATAINLLLCSLIGSGLGSLATGALSDALRPSFGEESLRYAMLILCPGFLWPAWHLWQASKFVTRDLGIEQQQHEGRDGTAYAVRNSPSVGL